MVNEGKPIDLFMATIKDKKAKGGDKENGGGGGGGGGGAAAAATLPALAGVPVAEAAQKAAEAGLVPEKVTQFSDKKKGDADRHRPGRGHQARRGREGQAARVRRLPAAGLRRRQERAARQRRQRQAPSRGRQGLPGGDRPDVLRRRRRRSPSSATAALFLKDLTKPDETPVALTASGEKFSDPAWAPTVDSNVIALLRDKSAKGDRSDQDLCLLQGRQGAAVAAVHLRARTSTWSRPSRWAPDGKSIFALGVNAQRVRHGALKSKKAFSPDAKDWGKGKLVTDTSQPGKGVIDFAISPDGKRMVAVANFDSDAFQLYLGKPKDFLLTDAKPLGVQACKGAWRSDGKEVVVVQADEECSAGQRADRARCRSSNPGAQQTAGLLGRQPRLPAADAGVAVLCTSCRRQLSRGADYCGNCGTPVAGAAAPLELVLADDTRVAARRRHDDRARAGQHAWCSPTRASRASTRASPPAATAAA